LRRRRPDRLSSVRRFAREIADDMDDFAGRDPYPRDPIDEIVERVIGEAAS
jgi:hypothetical protein